MNGVGIYPVVPKDTIERVEDCKDDLHRGRVRPLVLKRQGLTAIPESFLSGLENLQSLTLENNCIERLPNSFFAVLHQLTWLDMRYNHLVELPDSRPAYRNCRLKNLLLAQNRLERLPNELSEARHLVGLSLAGNPLVYPPLAIRDHGLEAIIRFLSKAVHTDDSAASRGGAPTLAALPHQDPTRFQAEHKPHNYTSSIPSLPAIVTAPGVPASRDMAQSHVRPHQGFRVQPAALPPHLHGRQRERHGRSLTVPAPGLSKKHQESGEGRSKARNKARVPGSKMDHQEQALTHQEQSRIQEWQQSLEPIRGNFTSPNQQYPTAITALSPGQRDKGDAVRASASSTAQQDAGKAKSIAEDRQMVAKLQQIALSPARKENMEKQSEREKALQERLRRHNTSSRQRDMDIISPQSKINTARDELNQAYAEREKVYGEQGRRRPQSDFLTSIDHKDDPEPTRPRGNH